MPQAPADKWEYPWYAAWDLAFHCIPLALVDAEFAKRQLDLLTREWFMHPNGQLPALRMGARRRESARPCVGDVACVPDGPQTSPRNGEDDKGDLEFLERVFHKLLLNFTWWVNRKDAQGRNIFQGGFLGSTHRVFDRSYRAHGRFITRPTARVGWRCIA